MKLVEIGREINSLILGLSIHITLMTTYSMKWASFVAYWMSISPVAEWKFKGLASSGRQRGNSDSGD